MQTDRHGERETDRQRHTARLFLYDGRILYRQQADIDILLDSQMSYEYIVQLRLSIFMVIIGCKKALLTAFRKKVMSSEYFNPLPSGTLAAFFLTAVGPIQHTKEGDISREKTILMT